MIYTVTLNPSLDYIVDVDRFGIGDISRVNREFIFAGGKGINVSTVLNNMGVDNTALGFIAGYTGAEIQRKLALKGVKTDFIQLKEGCSRINYTIRNFDSTSINGMGPGISSEDMELLINKISELVSGDVLIMSGSVPGSLPKTIYADIMSAVSDKGIKIIVDALGEPLLNTLQYHPFLIKPNHHELGDIFGVELQKKEEVAEYALRLQEMGACNILVSMAEKGAVLVTRDKEVYSCAAPEGVCVNPIGAGDSMVAGFVAEWIETGDMEKAFYMGVSAGSASAFSMELATLEEIICVRKQII